MRASGSCFVGLLVLTACPKKEEPRSAAPAVAAAPTALTGNAEIEFVGTFSPGKTTPAKSLFLVMEEPCLPVPAEVHLFGQQELKFDKLFAEFRPPQGSKGHACAYGINMAGKVMAVAAYGKNPVTMQGVGDIIVPNVDLILEPLAEPAPLPKGI